MSGGVFARAPVAPYCLWASILQQHTPFRARRDYFAEYRAEELTRPPRAAEDLENELPGPLVRARERSRARGRRGGRWRDTATAVNYADDVTGAGKTALNRAVGTVYGRLARATAIL